MISEKSQKKKDAQKEIAKGLEEYLLVRYNMCSGDVFGIR